MANVLAFGSFEDADNALKAYEIETENKFNVMFRTLNCRRLTSVDAEGLRNYVIKFADERGTVPIPFDGVPFILIGTEARECVYGKRRGKFVPKKLTSDDHSYDNTSLLLKACRRRKKIKYVSKKNGCPAQIHYRVIIRFPDFKINGDVVSRSQKKKLTDMIRCVKNWDTVKQEYRVLMNIDNNHKYHSGAECSLDTSASEDVSYQESKMAVSAISSIAAMTVVDAATDDDNVLKLKLAPSPRKKLKHKTKGILPPPAKICKLDSSPDFEEEEKTVIIPREIPQDSDLISTTETLNALSSIQPTSTHDLFINNLKSAKKDGFPYLDLRPVINRLKNQHETIQRLEKEVKSMRKIQEKQAKNINEMLELMKTISQSHFSYTASPASEVLVSEASSSSENHVIYESQPTSMQVLARDPNSNTREHYVIQINHR